jgi:hypothetical protein
MVWLSNWWPSLKPRSDITEKEIQDLAWAKRRALAVERYMIGVLIVLATFIVLVQFSGLRERTWFAVVVVVIAALNIVEVLQVTLNATVFDRYSGRPDDQVASTARMIVLAMVNFLELGASFGLIYSVFLEHLCGAHNTGDAFYFSAITQLTIGFGDIHPEGFLKAVVAGHGFAGVVFVLLVVARFVNALPQIKGRFDERVQD